MGSEVYANGNAIACKAGDAKVVAAFPDVCLSPPSPPAGPIPIPYPNSAFSKDMQDGSTTVKIGGKEVMLKDKSFYSSSPLGDEAATKSFGANVISHVITGKTYFRAWSMDVKFEGDNVDRHLDLTTSNHASEGPGEGVPTPDAEGVAVATPPKKADTEECRKAQEEKERICKSVPPLKKGKKVIANLENKKMTAHLTPKDISDRIKGFDDCLAARAEVTKHCFGGVTDADHAEQERQLGEGKAKTLALAKRLGF